METPPVLSVLISKQGTRLLKLRPALRTSAFHYMYMMPHMFIFRKKARGFIVV